MTYLILIVIAVAVALLDDRVRGKKKVPPPTVPQDIPRPKKRAEQNATFDIPPMRGVPVDVQISVEEEVLHAQELRTKWEDARKEAQRAKRAREREERAARLAAEEAALSAAPRAAGRRTAAVLPQLTPDAMKQAVVFAEILGKPRALRRFPQR
ncbi:hypothetical protein [uncultured Selenomonas sp.]|uniref:hypothetical protein n=1 Tax=uncultured Selenomonas sp. TaxID=159275 RepID=UPI0028EAFDD2|nr:hypothetical protein [uncultured Selenomonas sp.]